MLAKPQLRQEILQRRSRLTSVQSERAGRAIRDQLKHLPMWQQRPIVHCYLPIASKNEIDTWLIIKWWLSQGSEVWTSYLPNDPSQDGFCKIDSRTTYAVGRYGIPLPQAPVVQVVSPSVILVPCLAADIRGNRLGYGSGWYDWFLAKHPNAIRVGLVYDQFVYDQIPNDPSDQPLDILVTDKQVIKLKRAR